MQTATGAVAERLRHMCCDGTVLLRDLRRRHLEERNSVGGGQCIFEVEVNLKLAVGVFMVGLVDTPTECIKRMS